jgi:arylsulfatase A-like enzyme
MRRTISSFHSWLGFVLLAAVLFGYAADAAVRPNVVFILADDLGWADTSLYGHTTFYRTPNLDRLAKRGMTFNRAYAASPLCSPTRSSILTGLSPARIGITSPVCHEPDERLEATPGKAGPAGNKATVCSSATRLKTDYVTLAETLKAAGYATGHFGKWHLGPEPFSPLQQGFDVDVPHYAGPGPAGSYVAPWKFKDFDADPGEPDQHLEDRMAKEAVAFLEENKDKPFFLNYWMFSVHAPFNAKTNLIEKYRALADPNNPQRSPTYAAMVESMDDAVGTFLNTLDRLNLADKTVIVFFSDNGGNMYNEVDGTTPTSNAPLRGGKATLYEGGVRVPCVVCWPGAVAGGARSDAVIQSVDFYPTLLDMLALKPAEGQRFDGLSVVPALKGQPLQRDALFTYFPHDPRVPDWLPPAVSVLCGDWKLIRIFYGGENGAHRWKLFNIAADLGEKNDLAAQEPQRVKELDARIEAFLKETRAVVPLPNPAFDPAAYHPELEGVQQKQKPPQPKPGPEAQADWKARNCSVSFTNGIVTVRGTNDTPFLGLSAGFPKGPAAVRVRARAAAAGPGKLEGLSAAGQGDAQSMPFELKGGEWQVLTLNVPAAFPLNILRVYLPAQQQAVEVDWVEIKCPPDAKPRRWNF